MHQASSLNNAHSMERKLRKYSEYRTLSLNIMGHEKEKTCFLKLQCLLLRDSTLLVFSFLANETNIYSHIAPAPVIM